MLLGKNLLNHFKINQRDYRQDSSNRHEQNTLIKLVFPRGENK